MRTLAVLTIVSVIIVSQSIVWLAGPLVAQERSRNSPDGIFEPAGVELTAEQRTQIAALREGLLASTRKLQQQLGEIYTREQRTARQEAIKAARAAGKSGNEAREAVEAAVKITAEQKAEINKIRKTRFALIAKARADVESLLTPEQRKAVQSSATRSRSRASVKPTHPDLKYGPAARNLMDVWLAKSDKPTPVLVSIHGGGFRGGNKSVSGSLLQQCLDAGISVVAITYRLTDEAIAPAQMLDSARAIQFIRHNAKQWNVDPTRLAATGGSAGAGISLWLGFHDDLADPDNEDAVLRQSTRLTCMYVSGGQTSYDPRFIRDMFPDANVYQHSALFQLYDADLNKLDDLPKEKYELFESISPINFLTKDDAPAVLSYGMAMDAKPDIHHPLFGKLLKEKMDKLGIRCEVYAVKDVLGGGTRLSCFEFIKQEFGMK
ncbi:MAG: acetyl esterase [Pirellulaceae bacterium]|jgi:acetyl esterase